jgi:putative addiction module component (TIGR02574 family)
MLSTEELFSEAVSMPVDVRTELVDKLLKSLNPNHEEIEKMWAKVAEKRLKEIRNGKVKTISGEEVFSKIRKRFSK